MNDVEIREARSHLARLLAVENLWVRHQNVATASFDTVSRRLTLPIWTDVTESVFTMLDGHEVGHALYTPKQSLSEMAKQIDPKNIDVAADYLNVVEDARIERLIQATYPGLRATFFSAYEELFDNDFFGLNGSPVFKRCFIDRINLWFKVGSHVALTFTGMEKVLVDKVAN